MSSDPGVQMARERTLLVLMTLFAAVLGTMFSSMLVLAPTPLAILLYRHGLKAGISTALLSGLTVGFLMQHPIPMVLVLFILGVGIAIGEAWRDGLTLNQTLFVGWVVALLAFVSFFVVSRLVFEVDLFDEALQLWIEQVTKLGANGAMLPLSEAELSKVAQHLKALWPAMLVMSSGSICLVNYWLGGRWLRRLQVSVPWFPPFAHWRFPWYFTWGYIIGLGVPLLPLGRWPGLALVAVNLEMIFRFVFAIQGLAVVWFHLRKWNIRKWIAVVIAVLAVLFTPLLVFVGLLDSWFDIRRLDR